MKGSVLQNPCAIARLSTPAFILLVLCFLLSCNTAGKKAYTIGFSQCTMVNKWRQTMLEGMQRELSFHPEVQFIFKDANGNTQQQIRQIAELTNQNINLLIVSPNEAAPITSVVEKAYQKGIKVIIVDRRTLSDNFTAYVGASNYEVGASAAAYANSILKGKGNVLEISDIPGSSADIDRHKGFTDCLKRYSNVQYISKIYEAGDVHPSDEHTIQFLTAHPDINLIFAQNDRLAFSAYNACKKTGLDKKIKIIGVDGLAGANGKAHFVLHLMPLVNGNTISVEEKLIVLLGINNDASIIDADQLKSMFDLTPAEARLTRLLLEGESLETAARKLQVSVMTMRVHLRSVFAKVGVDRQTELMRNLHCLGPPR